MHGPDKTHARESKGTPHSRQGTGGEQVKRVIECIWKGCFEQAKSIGLDQQGLQGSKRGFHLAPWLEECNAGQA